MPSPTAVDPTFGSGMPVYITGIGAVTGYGWGTKALFDGLASGRSAVVLHDDLAGWVPDGRAYLATIDPAGADPADGPGRFLPALRFAGRQAVHEALRRGWQPGPTVGVIQAQGMGDSDAWSAFYKEPLPKPRVSPRRWTNMMLSTGTANFMSEFAFHGPSISVFADCATGNAALVLAKLWLNSGFASDVIVMATDLSSTPDNIRGFVDARVAVVDQPPFEANRPFQTGSKGFVGGEASVAMVLSPSPTGARATLHGGSTTSDGYSPISIAPDRIQLRRCYQEALTRSGVRAEDIVYFNAHGSGTAMCDAAESDLFDELFPTAEGIYSIKPFVGHCQTAASAVEVFAILYSYETGFIPAPPRVSPAHPRLLNGPKPCSPGLTLKSGVGMGGQNTAVILGDSPAG